MTSPVNRMQTVSSVKRATGSSHGLFQRDGYSNVCALEFRHAARTAAAVIVMVLIICLGSRFKSFSFRLQIYHFYFVSVYLIVKFAHYEIMCSYEKSMLYSGRGDGDGHRL